MPRTYRFFVNNADQINSAQGEVSVRDKNTIHQIKNVLRLTNDSPELIEFLDGSSKIIKSKISKIGSDSCSFNIIEEYLCERELDYEIDFLVPVIKIEAFEFMIRKLVELGVRRFIPVVFSRTQKQNLATINSDKSQTRIKKIIQEAVEQCEAALLPGFEGTIDFSQITQHIDKNQLAFFANERLADLEKAQPLMMDSLLAQKKISLLVGPEGGLTDEEVISLEAMGFQSISLGKRLLKSETAAIVTLSKILCRLELATFN